MKLGSLKEVAWRSGWIDDEQLLRLAEPLRKSAYGDYLAGLVSVEPDPESRMVSLLETQSSNQRSGPASLASVVGCGAVLRAGRGTARCVPGPG